MSHTNQTQYYELPQYVGTDIINPLIDTNDAYQKIDTTMHDIAEVAGQSTTDIAGLQNKVGTGVFETTAQNATGAVNELYDELNDAGTGVKDRVVNVENDVDTLQTQMQTANTAISSLQVEIASKADASDVSTLSDKVDKIPVGHKVLIFGDSYMIGIGGNANNDVELAIENLKGWNVTTYAEQGLGYIRTNSDGHNCLTLVNNAISAETDKDTITDCVLACSVYNEQGMISDPTFSYNGFYTAIKACVDALKVAFKNAKITIVPALWCNARYDATDGWSKVSRWETEVAKNLGLNYSKRSINWLMAYNNVSNSDNIHPNHAGYEIIGANIASIIEGTEPSLYSKYERITTNTDDPLVVSVNDDSIVLSAEIRKESGQSFSYLATLGEYARNLVNYPVILNSYTSVMGDSSTAFILDNNIVINSINLTDDRSYVIAVTIPIVPYNP